MRVVPLPPLPEYSDAYARVLGYVCSLMFQSSVYCQFPIACLHQWMRPALLLGQFAFVENQSSRLVGYLTWARLSSDTEVRLRSDHDVLFHLSEWNEGTRLWIMDMLLLDGRIRDLIGQLDKVLGGDRSFSYLKRSVDGKVETVRVWRISELGRWSSTQLL